MATQTETYKFNKPARTDNINVEKLNENFDIIEEELKKRPLNSDIPGNTFYDLDLSSWITVEFAGYALTSSTVVVESDDTNLPGGAEALLSAVASGCLPRIKLMDNTGAEIIVVLDECETLVEDEKTTVSYTGTSADAVYDVVDSYRLKVEVTSNNYAASFYARRNVVNSGTVKSVNGVAPDENGNVEVTVTEPATATLNFDNWDAEEGAYYREILDNGSSITHAIVRDANGKITSIGGIAIEGVS